MNGVRVKQEVKDLNDSLNDTIKSFSEELDFPAKTIKKAIQIEFKDNLKTVKEDQTAVEELLEIVKNNRSKPQWTTSLMR